MEFGEYEIACEMLIADYSFGITVTENQDFEHNKSHEYSVQGIDSECTRPRTELQRYIHGILREKLTVDYSFGTLVTENQHFEHNNSRDILRGKCDISRISAVSPNL